MDRIKSIIRWILSFETLFVLFLFAGRYKADPRFEWIPFDLTAFFFGASVCAGVLIIYRNKCKFSTTSLLFILTFLVFLSYVLMSLYWTPSTEYAYEKTFYLWTLTLWSVLATSLIISSNVQRVYRFLFMVSAFGVWILAESIVSILTSENMKFINVLGGNYIGVSRILGLLFIITLSYSLFKVKSKKYKVSLYIFLAVVISVMFSTGSRGPLLAILIALTYLFIRAIYIRRSTIQIKKSFFTLFSGFILITLYMLYLFVNDKLPSSINRVLVVFTQDDFGSSAGARVTHYMNGIELWKDEFLFGHGIGSWGILNYGSDERSYPHNILLEVGVELGILGLLLFFLIHIIPLQKLLFSSYISRTITLILIFLGVNSLISGDLNDNRYYFSFMGLAMCINSLALKENKSYEGLYGKHGTFPF
ncbi:O-antigen ligase family protein [Virgibacillus xinjiangensis]|uniref:O-antigen ligase family protein n=1 Tax=Virgibacillus xinjiangensis TaxID=393090 RepID=A0ABV7CTX6_9BACI